MRQFTQQDLIDIRMHFPIEHCLPAPDLQVSLQEASAFDALYNQALRDGPGTELSYDLPYPKYLFLDYLASKHKVMFHGSQVTDIKVLEPIRNSRDSSEFGDQAAIYGTQDPLWALFFALLDRSMLQGTITNGAIQLQGDDGSFIRRYFYCVDAPSLRQNPWKPGTMYLLPGEGFEPDPAEVGLRFGDYTMIPTHWIHRGALQPLAHLAVQPEDFPFLSQVWGYDPAVMERRLNETSVAGWPFLGDRELYTIHP